MNIMLILSEESKEILTSKVLSASKWVGGGLNSVYSICFALIVDLMVELFINRI